VVVEVIIDFDGDVADPQPVHRRRLSGLSVDNLNQAQALPGRI